MATATAAGRAPGYSKELNRLVKPISVLLNPRPLEYNAAWSDPADIDWFEKHQADVMPLAEADPTYNISWQQFVHAIVEGVRNDIIEISPSKEKNMSLKELSDKAGVIATMLRNMFRHIRRAIYNKSKKNGCNRIAPWRVWKSCSRIQSC